MVPLLSLWLPILLATLGCFILSSVIWMASPLHKHDYKKPGDREIPLMDFVRSQGFEPGVYYVPFCKGKPTDEAQAARVKNGPWAQLIVMPGTPNMGKMLGLWGLNLLLITLMVAYVASTSRPAGAGFFSVFQVAMTAAALGHMAYALPLSIWHGLPWSQLPGRLVDGALYAAVTGAAFAGLWPGAPMVG